MVDREELWFRHLPDDWTSGEEPDMDDLMADLRAAIMELDEREQLVLAEMFANFRDGWRDQDHPRSAAFAEAVGRALLAAYRLASSTANDVTSQLAADAFDALAAQLDGDALDDAARDELGLTSLGGTALTDADRDRLGIPDRPGPETVRLDPDDLDDDGDGE